MSALNSIAPFAYQAQTAEGQPISGTIDALSIEQAQRLLSALRLRVLNVEPAAAPPRPSPRPLKTEDFVAFNQQLAHLASAGMPIEQGLRLIAQDMRRGRLAATVRDVAAELERGTPLEQAFEMHQQRFPALYARLIAAGVSSGNLPGVLMNLGRHMELVQRLRAALWRAAAYPLMVLIGVALVVLFISVFVIPRFALIFADFGIKLPAITQFMLELPLIVPWIFGVVAAVIIALMIVVPIMKRSRTGRVIVERVTLATPLIGPILRYNLLARWCDAAALAIHSGLDLPRAIDLANDTVASPLLRHDGEELRAALLAGKPLDSVQHTRILPATVVAAMTLAANQSDLPRALATLSEMYQQQSRLRLTLLPGVLTPLLIMLLAGIVGLVILGIFAPLISLIQAISG